MASKKSLVTLKEFKECLKNDCLITLELCGYEGFLNELSIMYSEMATLKKIEACQKLGESRKLAIDLAEIYTDRSNKIFELLDKKGLYKELI